MLDDDAALSELDRASRARRRASDELGAVLRKCDSHGERVGALFDYGGRKRAARPTARSS